MASNSNKWPQFIKKPSKLNKEPSEIINMATKPLKAFKSFETLRFPLPKIEARGSCPVHSSRNKHQKSIKFILFMFPAPTFCLMKPSVTSCSSSPKRWLQHEEQYVSSGQMSVLVHAQDPCLWPAFEVL